MFLVSANSLDWNDMVEYIFFNDSRTIMETSNKDKQSLKRKETKYKDFLKVLASLVKQKAFYTKRRLRNSINSNQVMTLACASFSLTASYIYLAALSYSYTRRRRHFMLDTLSLTCCCCCIHGQSHYVDNSYIVAAQFAAKINCFCGIYVYAMMPKLSAAFNV